MGLEVRNLTTGYEHDFPIVSEVSFAVPAARAIGVIGPNGAGKTTLIRALSGEIRMWSGEVTFDGARIDQMDCRHRIFKGVATVPENRKIFPSLSVLENLKVAAVGAKCRLDSATLGGLCELFPILGERSGAPGSSLSGGEQQMLAIARALVSKPRLLLMDEPSLGLSPLMVERVGEVIAELVLKGLSVLIVEQNQGLVAKVCEEALLLTQGRVAEVLQGKFLLERAEIAQAYLS